MIQHVEVSDGAEVEWGIELHSLEEAEEILLKDKRQLYVTAQRKEGYGLLCRPFFRCPECGTESPAYSQIVLHQAEEAPVVDEEEIKAWADRQCSLLEEKDTLYMREPLLLGEYAHCCYCNRIVKMLPPHISIEIQSGDGVVLVGRAHYNLKELMQIPWAPDEMELKNVPVIEMLEFDLRHQRVKLRLAAIQSQEEDTLQIIRDVEMSTQFNLIRLGKFLQYVEKEEVRRVIHRAFTEEMGCEPPIPTCVARLKDYIMMTRFYGFSREFYDAIPYAADSDCLEPSFRKWAENLKNAEDMPDLLKASSLPDVKSVKRIFYKNQGLLFYLPECEVLYELLRDVNLFCNFLQKPSVFELLLHLHMYPGIITFYRDFAEKFGADVLAGRLSSREEPFFRFALSYYAMNEEMRKQKMECFEKDRRYLKHRRVFRYEKEPIPISHPMMKIPSYLKETVIDGYLFAPLRTSADFIRAGNELKNCLADWTCNNNPVVVVYKGNLLVAAVEMENKEPVQAYLYDNEEISEEKEVYEVYLKWCDMMQNQNDETSVMEEEIELVLKRAWRNVVENETRLIRAIHTIVERKEREWELIMKGRWNTSPKPEEQETGDADSLPEGDTASEKA